MTLPSSGAISIGDIYTEITETTGTNIVMGDIRNGNYGALNHSNYPLPSNPYLLSTNQPYKISDFYGYNHRHPYIVYINFNNYSSYTVDFVGSLTINGSVVDNFSVLGVSSYGSDYWISNEVIYPYINGSGDQVEIYVSANGGHSSITFNNVTYDFDMIVGSAAGNPFEGAFYIMDDFGYGEANITIECVNV